MRHYGWMRDIPSLKDWPMEKVMSMNAMLAGATLAAPGGTAAPTKTSMRSYCSPVEDQGQYGSCTGHASVGAVEIYERRAYGKHIDASRAFVYWCARKLLGLTGDTGAYLRTVMGVLALYGVPPEQYWPYRADYIDKEPPAWVFGLAGNYKAGQYFKCRNLDEIKLNLANGIPVMFGFTVFSSVAMAETTGLIPYPDPSENIEGGHAVLAIGYDDAKKIGQDVGALEIRNSWGKGWGDRGYGWLPYRYFTGTPALADDAWALVKAGWVDIKLFK